ncbi:hypothetical protein CKA32_002862 [Geitlerinema sp. FC II]|nr:hypothetical protein CKA32_002862 [Geitlerinema sp. FC II]
MFFVKKPLEERSLRQKQKRAAMNNDYMTTVLKAFCQGASHFRKYTSSAICQYLPQGLLEGDLLL